MAPLPNSTLRTRAITHATQLSKKDKDHQALKHMLRYLAQNSGDTQVFNLTGTLAAKIGDWVTAEVYFVKALALNEDDKYALYNLSKVYKLSSRETDAIILLGRLIHLDPKNATALNEIGTLLFSRGDLEPAIRALETAVRLNPGFEMAYRNLYLALFTGGQYNEAANIAKQALDLVQDDHRWNIRADLIIFLWKALELDEAKETAESLIAEIERSPLPQQKNALIHARTNYGLVLMEQNEPDAAETQFRKVIALEPTMVEPYINMGKLNAYREHFQEAIHWFDQAAAINPEHAELHTHLAIFLRDAGRPDLALPHHRSAVAQSSGNVENRFYLGITLFALGQLQEAYPNWEMRWARREGGSKSNLSIPEWTGTPSSGKSLLIYREQGLGDEVLFANCLPDACHHFERVVYICHSKLHKLLARSFPNIEFRSGNYQFSNADVASFEWQIPIGTLPSIFRPDINSFPKRPQLLTPDPIVVETFHQRLKPLRKTLTIGIAWRSGLLALHRKLLYPYLEFWETLLTTPGITWVNLQYGDVSNELQMAEEKFGVAITNFTDVDHFNDLDMSAALMKACDIVIGPETSTTLISAAVGTPTLRMSTGCDHFRLGTDHYPWFPAITPVSRHFGESWDGPIGRAAQIIATLINDSNQKGSRT